MNIDYIDNCLVGFSLPRSIKVVFWVLEIAVNVVVKIMTTFRIDGYFAKRRSSFSAAMYIEGL